MIVALGLLWGEKDFGQTLCRAVQPCFDTDCNGATAGSVIGILHGAKNVPEALDRALQRHPGNRRRRLPSGEGPRAGGGDRAVDGVRDAGTAAK